MEPDSQRRHLLMGMFEAAVAAAQPAHCLPTHLPPPPARGRIIVVGAGKAAAAMAVATQDTYRARGEIDRISGAVVTRHGFALPTHTIAIDEAGHPVPDAASEAAARRALALAHAAGPGDLVVCLLSGGASALWSLPTPYPASGLDLAAKQALTRELLRCGAPISAINCVRRHLSGIKGGRLAQAAAPAPIVTLAISDVAGDDPATIGSGPTVADPTTLADARDVLARYRITPAPAIVAALRDPANETVKSDARFNAAVRYVLAATPRDALSAAASVARAAGYDVQLLGDAIEGEARDVAVAHARIARAAYAEGRRVVILSGGEVTVTVRGTGRGGPNQEYALALACALDGHPGIWALAADTDGIDGGGGAVTDPAGAIVTPDTLSRHRNARNPAMILAENDSTSFFAALGDLVFTGPTQTNVNDLRAIIVDT